MLKNVIRFFVVVAIVLAVAFTAVVYTLKHVAVIRSADTDTVYLEVFGNVWEKGFSDFPLAE